jgi:thymidylate kinase
MDSQTLTALFSADRLDHLYGKGGVVDHLMAGEWVIMDRYYLSSLAYQTLNIDDDGRNWIWDLHEYCIMPDVTFFLDLPVKTCMQRISLNRGFHFELFENEEILDAVYLNYLHAIQQLRLDGENIQILDGSKKVISVAKNVRERVERLFLDDTRLLDKEEQALWKDWPVLSTIRKDIEKNLHLTFILVKKIAESEQAAHGGYQIEFASYEKIYHVQAYLADNRTKLRILATGQADPMLNALKAICEHRPISIKDLPLFTKEK